jgi:hypothetical protein
LRGGGGGGGGGEGDDGDARLLSPPIFSRLLSSSSCLA